MDIPKLEGRRLAQPADEHVRVGRRADEDAARPQPRAHVAQEGARALLRDERVVQRELARDEVKVLARRQRIVERVLA